MSRHRDIRKLDYDEEYDQAYDDAVYGRSVDDYDYGVSPGMEEYLYSRSRDNSNKFAAYFHTDEDIEEVEEANEYIEDEKGEMDRARHDSSSFERPKLSDGDEKRLSSALDEIRNIVGDQFSETEMVRMVLRHSYDINAAVSALLENSCPPCASTALPQRERRQRNKDSCILQLNSDYAILPYHGYSPVLSFIGSKCVKTNVQRMVKDWMLELERKRKKVKASEEKGRVKEDSVCSSESMSTDTNEESESTVDKEVEYLGKEIEQEMELEISCPVDEVDSCGIPGGEREKGEERVNLTAERDLFSTSLFRGRSACVNVEDGHRSKCSVMPSKNSDKILECSRIFPDVSSHSGSVNSRNSDVCPVLTNSNLPNCDLAALASSCLGTYETKGSSGSAPPASLPESSTVSAPASSHLGTSGVTGSSLSSLSRYHLGTSKQEGSGLHTLGSSSVESSKFGGALSALASSQSEASVPKSSTLSAISSSYLQPSSFRGSSFTPLACSPKASSISGSPNLSDLASSHLKASIFGDSSPSTYSSSNVGIPKLGGSSLSSLASSHLGSSKPRGISLSSLANSHLGSPKPEGTTFSSLANSQVGSPQLGGTSLSSLASSHMSTSLSSPASSRLGSPGRGNATLSSLASSHLGSPGRGNATLSSLASSHLGSPGRGNATLSSLASSHLGSPGRGNATLSSLASSHLGSPGLGNATLSSLASSHLGSPGLGNATLSSLASSHLGSPGLGNATLSSLASSHLGSPQFGGTSLSSLASSHLGVTRLEGSSFNTSSSAKGNQFSGNDGISSNSSISSTSSSYIIPALTTNSRLSGSKPGSEHRALDSRLGSFGIMNQFLSSYSDNTQEKSDQCDIEGSEAHTGNAKVEASSLESLAQLHLSKSQSSKFDGNRKISEEHMNNVISDRKVEPDPVDYMFFSSPFEDFTEDTEKDCEMDDIDLSIAFTKQQEYEKIKPPVLPKLDSEIDADLDLEGCPFAYDENLRHIGPISDLGHLLIKSEFTCKVKQFRFSTIEVDLPVFEFDTPSPDDIVRQSLSEKNKT